jgi:hypothetical protein
MPASSRFIRTTPVSAGTIAGARRPLRASGDHSRERGDDPVEPPPERCSGDHPRELRDDVWWEAVPPRPGSVRVTGTHVAWPAAYLREDPDLDRYPSVFREMACQS